MMFVAEQPETVNKKCIDEVMMEAQGTTSLYCGEVIPLCCFTIEKGMSLPLN